MPKGILEFEYVVHFFPEMNILVNTLRTMVNEEPDPGKMKQEKQREKTQMEENQG